MRMTERIDHIKVRRGTKAKLKKMAKQQSPRVSFAAYCAHILELHADGSNGLRELTHPVKQKGKR